jgi:hypothetical protein
MFPPPLRGIRRPRRAVKKVLGSFGVNSYYCARVRLRRNVHRLNEGFLMKPRRVPFTPHYITRTVGAHLEGVNCRHIYVGRGKEGWAGEARPALQS